MNQEHIQKLIDSLEQRVSKFENKSPVSQSLLDDDYNRMNRFVKSYFELDLITHEVRENYLNRIEAAYKHYRTHPDQKLAKNKENTTGSSQKSDRATPIYNMGVTVVGEITDSSTLADIRLQTDQYTFPRKLDNSQIIVTERGAVPIIHSVPCDREGFASIDWVSIGIGQETLGDEYFSIDKNSSSVDDIGNTFTLEGLINVQNFSENSGQAFISTFMGTEGGTLLRFGDTGNPSNRLQTNGAGTELAVNFAVNKWYHVALVVNGNKTIAYINGEKVDEFAKNGRLGEFYIGRSYNGDRGIAAHFSELRLWKVARSAAQIKDNMYDVATNAEGLYAYWKMNKVENNKIPDVSGNGRELILRGQKNKNGRLDITIHNESKNVKIGE